MNSLCTLHRLDETDDIDYMLAYLLPSWLVYLLASLLACLLTLLLHSKAIGPSQKARKQLILTASHIYIYIHTYAHIITHHINE